MEDNLKKFALFTCVLFERNFFPTLLMGVMYSKSVSGCLWTTHATYSKWVTRLFVDFPLSNVLTVGMHESRHQWHILLPQVTFPDNLQRFELLADDLTRHWPWVPYVIETRGPFPEWKGLFFRGRDHAPLFTRVVGGVTIKIIVVLLDGSPMCCMM